MCLVQSRRISALMDGEEQRREGMIWKRQGWERVACLHLSASVASTFAKTGLLTFRGGRRRLRVASLAGRKGEWAATRQLAQAPP